MEIPQEISKKAAAWIGIGVAVVLFFVYRGYVNSRQALQILDNQVPNITRVAFETEVVAPTEGNLDAILKQVKNFGNSPDIDRFKKRFPDHLWIGLLIRNRGLKMATDIAARIRLTAPISAVEGFSSTDFGKLETRGEALGKDEIELNWNYLEPGHTAVIFLGVRPKEIDSQPPYSRQQMQLWARDFKIYFELAQIQTKEGSVDYAY